jgi:hypothetical protein
MGFNWTRQRWDRKIEHEQHNAPTKAQSKRRRKSKPVAVVVVTQPAKPIQPHAEHAFSQLSPSNPRYQLPGVDISRPPWH